MMAEEHPHADEHVSIEVAARRLGVTAHTVNVYIRQGKLPVWEISRRVRFVIWSAISAEMQAIADAHAAGERRRPGSRGSTMRRSRPDDPSGS